MSTDDNKAVSEKLYDLANGNSTDEIIDNFRFAYFPFANFVFTKGDPEGIKLLTEYEGLHLKIKDYVTRKSQQ